ncbi:MAG: VWA domain-containing protein, partial [Acidimicrobiales bacterium]|nr:VWA domain-containing protein [Acidimicrobiales bacterium]
MTPATVVLAVSFLDPAWLLLLLAPAAMLAVYVVLQQRRPQYAVRFTNLELLDKVAPKRPGWRRHVTAGVFLIALAALIVAVARPTRDVQVPVERATVVMAIDTSLSMEATDVAPSRLEAAQEAANRFVELLPPSINLGLVTFNGTAQVAVAPTTDRDAVTRAIDGLELGESTATGDAIFASLDAIESVPDDGTDEPVPARVVLMSDGTRTVGRPEGDAAAAAVEADVPVSTIAFGTPNGTIEYTDETTPPTIVPVPVDEVSLQNIADATGGSAFTAASEAELSQVFDDIGSSVGYETEQREITP